MIMRAPSWGFRRYESVRIGALSDYERVVTMEWLELGGGGVLSCSTMLQG